MDYELLFQKTVFPVNYFDRKEPVSKNLQPPKALVYQMDFMHYKMYHLFAQCIDASQSVPLSDTFKLGLTPLLPYTSRLGWFRVRFGLGLELNLGYAWHKMA